MARQAQGWQLVWRRGIARVRFSHEGTRHEISTGSRDPREAHRTAARIYSDVVTGRVKRSSGGLAHPQLPLAELAADWIAAIEPELGRGTPDTFTVYAGHWARFFGRVGELSTPRCAQYIRARLREVQAGTVRKELSALRRFAGWLVERGYLAEAPEVPAVPRKALGTKKEGRRGRAAELTLDECRALLAALPAMSDAIVLRARFVLAFETALRPTALDLIQWKDITAFGLHLRAEVDKNRWERTVPLSAPAREALAGLERGEPDTCVFGKHDLRDSFKAAASAVLGAERGKLVSQYALKHARITSWFEAGADVPAVKFLTGITQTSTLDRYMRASRRSAERLVFWGHSGALPGVESCEGRESNPHGSYPASTSSSEGDTDPAKNKLVEVGK